LQICLSWRAAVDKVLKGADFEKRLVGRSADGIRIEPLYPPPDPHRPVRGEAGRWHVAARVDHPVPARRKCSRWPISKAARIRSCSDFAGARAARGYGLVADDVARSMRRSTAPCWT
jgi:methylmalonyl-CoA mutase